MSEIKLIFGEDGKASLYDDTYDITIHCESKEEQEEVERMLQNTPHWIPVTERLPEYGKAVLTVNKDGDYEINHIIDDEEGDFFYYGAIAWMPLPESYKGG